MARVEIYCRPSVLAAKMRELDLTAEKLAEIAGTTTERISRIFRWRENIVSGRIARRLVKAFGDSAIFYA